MAIETLDARGIWDGGKGIDGTNVRTAIGDGDANEEQDFAEIARLASRDEYDALLIDMGEVFKSARETRLAAETSRTERHARLHSLGLFSLLQVQGQLTEIFPRPFGFYENN